MFDRKYEYVWYDNFFYPASSYQPMFCPAPAARSMPRST
jgi:iron complex outermembrane receptor protein